MTGHQLTWGKFDESRNFNATLVLNLPATGIKNAS
jgi:hypothetical protein